MWGGPRCKMDSATVRPQNLQPCRISALCSVGVSLTAFEERPRTIMLHILCQRGLASRIHFVGVPLLHGEKNARNHTRTL
jgi:hypothetical protein